MIDALKNDVIVKKVGGRFKLAVLMQKRMVDVAFGAPLLVDAAGKTMAEGVVQEILEEKISLDLSGGVVESEEDAETAEEE
ncbi:MAG: DNA-directed RNA polymerase subunit omega [Planctomycetes bacterium]|nr:DNA-directed RNA polymerase subunit omega [Planctomycetota bacterium]